MSINTKITNDRLLKVLSNEPVDRTPAWLMRQAGRYMPEYRELRAKYSFLEVCKNAELAYTATMQPIKAFNPDAAILFSDILIPLEAMGFDLDFKPAPCIANNVKDFNDINSLRVPDPEEIPYASQAIQLLVKDLEVPLIGFAGAPFTLACYAFEGEHKKGFTAIRKAMYDEPEMYQAFMEMISETVKVWLITQIDAGASVVQIFDTWAEILPRKDFEEYVYPYVNKLIKELRRYSPSTKIIYFAKGSTNYPIIGNLDVDALGVDWKLSLSDSSKVFQDQHTLQGNLDPSILLCDADIIEKQVKDQIEQGRELPKGYSFNLGHGITPAVPVENVQRLFETVQAYGSSK